MLCSKVSYNLLKKQDTTHVSKSISSCSSCISLVVVCLDPHSYGRAPQASTLSTCAEATFISPLYSLLAPAEAKDPTLVCLNLRADTCASNSISISA